MTTAAASATPRFNSQDLLASLVVFLVALPLCMGIAIASGAPPALGLITGVVGGLVVGALAGSPLQVSGPAAGMAVLVYDAVTTHGLAMLGVIVLMAGALQLAAGVARLGQWFRAISPSVIHGMLAGIGVLIFASQFQVMVHDRPEADGLANLLAIPAAVMKAVATTAGSPHQLAALVGVSTIISILLWNKFKPKALRMIPGPLLGILVGTGLAKLFDLQINRVQVPESLTGALNIPSLESLLSGAMNPAILTLGLVFAFVASAETLLCATAVDQMHTGPRTNYDKELRAQGIGNLLCGAVGALPMTGVIVRSSANVQAGATTRLSAILHGAWLLLTVAALPWLLNNIPEAALAAILVYTGYKLVNLAQVRKIGKFGRMELAIYFVTLAGVVAIDLLTGVLAGFALATINVVYHFSHLEVETRCDAESNRCDIYLVGAATFFSIPKLAAELEKVGRGAEAHIHVEELDHIDHACLDMLSAWEKQHQSTGGRLVLEWRDVYDRYSRRSAERVGERRERQEAAQAEASQPAE